MGRHSRRKSTTKGDSSKGDSSGGGIGTRGGVDAGTGTGGDVGSSSTGAGARAAQAPRPGRGPQPGTDRPGAPRFGAGDPGRGVPRLADGTPAHGFPRLPDGTPAHGFPRLPGPRFPDGTPAHGMPRFSDGTPARGVPQARGGHPEQAEAGGGWGELRGQGGAPGFFGGRQGPAAGVPRGPAAGAPVPPGTGPGLPIPRQRQALQDGTRPGGRRGRGPRQDYVDAFDGDDVFTPRAGVTTHRSDPYASVTDWPPGYDTGTDARTDTESGTGVDVDNAGAPPGGRDRPGVGSGPARGGKGRTYTGIAAAAVTTVLAVVVAGQVAGDGDKGGVRSEAATDQARDVRGAGAASGEPSASASPQVTTLTYAQKMDKKYPLSATLKGPDKFDAVPGVAKAPGKGRKYTYRVDVEQGLGLDGALFAEAVQKTLNDNRSWAHNGGRTFERIYSGKPDFVITLASPGTTAKWCAKSGLDTTEDNVSCDSAATERVLINAYRWAQGSSTYGDKMYAYREMLINHEVGHRLGYGHVTCDKNGELAPVMQQQTKFLDHDGIHCLPNPWPYPGS
ncbi:DUF3152 domain-containing protein [Streptomyces sp. NPDC101175]|uniref:DUF3152 domain-containing protein n=1 Tax=Streptomyces sp. NPDC101175 TaxID=3366123 RepID=UPI003837BA18